MSQVMESIIEEQVIRVDQTRVTKRYFRKAYLGKGGFAMCYQVICQQTGQTFALKAIKKQNLTVPRAKAKLYSEIKIHQSLHHPNVVGFVKVFQDQRYVFILLEYCQGALNQVIKNRAQYFTFYICKAVDYLHQNRLIHRDLKLGNIFLDKTLRPKLGDFGLAAKLQFDTDKRRSLCGTPNYIAPEVINHGSGHSFPVDVWAIGIIVYTLQVGTPPFETASIYKTYNKITTLDYQIPVSLGIHESAADLIKKIIVTDPSKRPTTQQILQHPFLNPTQGILKWLPISAMYNTPFITSQNYSSFEQGQLSLQALGDKIVGTTKYQPRALLDYQFIEGCIQFSKHIYFKISSGVYGVASKSLILNRLRDGSIIEVFGKNVLSYHQSQAEGHYLEFQRMMKQAQDQLNPFYLRSSQVFLKSLARISQGVLMRLSNGVIQMWFSDKTSIVILDNQYKFISRKMIVDSGRLIPAQLEQMKGELGNKLTYLVKVLKRINQKFKAKHS